MATYAGKFKFEYEGEVELTAADEHAAHVAINDLIRSVIDEIGNWPTTDTKHMHTDSEIIDITNM
jgi:hypothetical protein